MRPTPSKSYPRIHTLLLTIALVAMFGTGYATHLALAGDKQATPAAGVAKVFGSLYLDAAESANEETEELLMGILALEKLHPVVMRSYGYQYSWHAERCISASRLLTDMQVAEHYPEVKPRLERLRKALETFAENVPDAAMSHNPIASAYQRETRIEMVELERRIRIEIVGGDGVQADFGRMVKPCKGSPPIDIASIRSIVLRSKHVTADFMKPEEVMQERQRLIDSLPQLQEALKEWPPEFSRNIQAFIHGWMKAWFED